MSSTRDRSGDTGRGSSYLVAIVSLDCLRVDTCLDRGGGLGPRSALDRSGVTFLRTAGARLQRVCADVSRRERVGVPPLAATPRVGSPLLAAAATDETLPGESQEKPRTDLRHPLRGWQSNTLAPSAAQRTHEIALRDRVGCCEVDWALHVLPRDEERDGTREVMFVNPRHELLATGDRSAEAHARQTKQHIEDATAIRAHHHRGAQCDLARVRRGSVPPSGSAASSEPCTPSRELSQADECGPQERLSTQAFNGQCVRNERLPSCPDYRSDPSADLPLFQS